MTPRDHATICDLLNAGEIALIWETDPNWRLPVRCHHRDARHAEAVDLVCGILDREMFEHRTTTLAMIPRVKPVRRRVAP